jgi:glycosyltransferase involved in cell wall biosynthesis
MRSLDIVVHASTEPEPFGMVIIEAMACGTPIIVSAAGGASELFEEGENAISHQPGDAAALARQIERLARDPELRQRLAVAGRARAERFFPGSRMAEEVLALYRDIHGESAGVKSGSVVRTVPVASE